MRRLIPHFALALAACTGSSSAALFSFAGGSDADGFLFEHQDGYLTDYKNTAFVDLLIDLDDDGPSEPLRFETSFFSASISLTYQQSQSLPGGQYSHLFTAEGSFSLWEECGCRMMFYCNFEDAPFASLSADLDAIGSTAMLQGEDGGQGLVYYAPGPVLMDYGITEFFAPFDFSFVLTNINGGSGAPLTGGQLGSFAASGSYSGSALIPAPATAAALGILAGAHDFRRRRT